MPAVVAFCFSPRQCDDPERGSARGPLEGPKRRSRRRRSRRGCAIQGGYRWSVKDSSAAFNPHLLDNHDPLRFFTTSSATPASSSRGPGPTRRRTQRPTAEALLAVARDAYPRPEVRDPGPAPGARLEPAHRAPRGLRDRLSGGEEVACASGAWSPTIRCSPRWPAPQRPWWKTRRPRRSAASSGTLPRWRSPSWAGRPPVKDLLDVRVVSMAWSGRPTVARR